MAVCVSCMDEDEDVVYTCKGDGGICSYELCGKCVKLAFSDSSGANSAFCAMCKSPSALDMIAAVCGNGAIMAVEEKLRGKVEFKMKEEQLKRETSRVNASDLNEKARRIFNDLAEKIILKCPRCQMAFNDYDGCNALTCGAPSCKAGFCAICLKDCGRDAHQHVREAHGGLNQNNRMVLLEKHVEKAPMADVMFEPLRHLIGVGLPLPVITEMHMEIPQTQVALNDQQLKVAHPLRLKTAVEVAGPPGTGKTKTIVELVRALLHCTDYDVLLMSERNGAINAVAEKFKDSSVAVHGKSTEITDIGVWASVMTYGSGESMGESTRMFTLEEKIRMHPESIDSKEKLTLLQAASETLAKSLREELAKIIIRFGRHFEEGYAVDMSKAIRNGGAPELKTPLGIISAVQMAMDDIEELLVSREMTGSKFVDEENTSNLISRHSHFLARLIPDRTPKEREEQGELSWDAKEATKRLRYIHRHFNDVLNQDIFSSDNASNLHEENIKANKEHTALLQRLTSELPSLARLHMSTIGSSHRLPGDKNSVDDLKQICVGDLEDEFEQMVLVESDEDDIEESTPSKDTIVIFDEAGCIPAYELFGLSRLGRTIKALVLVGDKKQLPPYDPMAGRNSERRGSFGSRGVKKIDTKLGRTHSLLDCSVLDVDTGKVRLTTQYRVPKDIAEMLNQRVYHGQYNTCPKANVPLSGLCMIHVEWSESNKRKYVNPNEIKKGLELLNQLSLDSTISNTLIITPYKNQQREFEFRIDQLMKNGQKVQTSVLTIDQCQGQEADAVILSLVRRPTRFLNLNRLNVALSRVRKKLYVLTDFQDLQVACRNKDWDCVHLVADLLTGV